MAVVALLVSHTDFGDEEEPKRDLFAVILLHAWWMAATCIGAMIDFVEQELDEMPEWSVAREWVLLGTPPDKWLVTDV